ncbi:MAG: hypothetical protein GY930_00445 [bacterium]|nr:hypothetical protein [bacterium]
MSTTIQDIRKNELLDAAKSKFGFIPNVLKQMATSPAALEVYMGGQEALGNEGNRLTPEQRNFVQLAVSQRNGCDYCTAAHAAMGKMQGSNADDVKALATGNPIAEDAGGAYVDAAFLIMDKQGHLGGQDLSRLEAQGIDREKIYEIIGSIAIKQVSNWVNHIANTKVDAQFQ